MRLRLIAVLAAGIGAGLVDPGGRIRRDRPPKIRTPVTIHVIEHARTDTVIDTGRKGDTTGDLLTFHNPVFDATDSARAGRDQGQCIRHRRRRFLGVHVDDVPAAAARSPSRGRSSTPRNSVLAVTGGTGIYRNARGAMLLKSRAGGTKFDFVFRLVP